MFLSRGLPVYIVGIIEGIIIPLSIYSFLHGTGAPVPIAIKYTIGISILLALMMAMGAYFTRRAEIANKANSKMLSIYRSLDIDDAIKEEMTRDTLAENQAWDKEWDETGNSTGAISSGQYGVMIFSGYFSGIIAVTASALVFAGASFQYLITPMVLLAVSGYAKYQISGRNPFKGLLLITLAGLAAALGAYYAAGLF